MNSLKSAFKKIAFYLPVVEIFAEVLPLLIVLIVAMAILAWFAAILWRDLALLLYSEASAFIAEGGLDFLKSPGAWLAVLLCLASAASFLTWTDIPFGKIWFNVRIYAQVFYNVIVVLVLLGLFFYMVFAAPWGMLLFIL